MGGGVGVGAWGGRGGKGLIESQDYNVLSWVVY